MIQTGADLCALVDVLRLAEWLALDTEADSLHSYPEKVCLIQLGLPDREVLVDPLANLDLSPLWTALAGRELLLHGADYDLRILHREFSFVPATIFDTMLAARLLGAQEFGLDALLRQHLGLTLDKGMQKANWALRPLPARMEAYARNDVRHLQPLAQILRTELERLDRLPWHQEVCAQLIADCTHPPAPNPDDDWRLKGSDRLPRRALAVLRELWLWREEEALSAGKPPYFVLSHETLLHLATTALPGPDHPLEESLPNRLSGRRREGVRQAIDRAFALPESELPHPRRHRGHRLTPAQRQRLDHLRQHRDAVASSLGLDPALIASRATLTRLAADWDKHAPSLLSWQRNLLKPVG